MNITYFGHACFYIELEGKSIIIDPFISPNDLAKSIDVDNIKIDYMFISHGHEDHVADAERIMKNNPDAVLVSNFEIASWFAGKGVKNYHPMNLGGEKTFDFGMVKSVNAVHSSVLPDGTYGGNPGGFVFKTQATTFYYAGDTALTMDMKLIPMSFNLDFAILPIGDNFTMGVSDALIASDFIDCNRIVGMHYDTFPYIVIDKNEAKERFNRANKELTLPEIGVPILL
jgi:L-ascorbate metabolism protein UlaG (beta-lactamase superfamily)